VSVDGAIERVVAARHPPQTEWLWTEMSLLEERWDALGHPFYERWCAGRLTPGELQLYASEYDHLVVAIAALSARASSKADGLLAIDSDDAPTTTTCVSGRFGASRRWPAGVGASPGTTTRTRSRKTLACALALAGGRGQVAGATS